MAGNTKLIEYGLRTEVSDWRAHVSFATGHVYTYRTEHAQAMDLTKYRERRVTVNGVVTAVGYLVPPRDIPCVRIEAIPDDVFAAHAPNEHAQASAKGEAATSVVLEMIRRGRMPWLISVNEERNLKRQYEGVDITVTISVQVKCDYNGGLREWGGTGNLFLQTEECNPHSQH